MTTTLKDYPILRLAIPLSTGIFFARTFHPYFSMEWMMGLMVAFVFFLGICIHGHSFKYRWCFGILLFSFFFFVGAFRMTYQCNKVNVDWSENKQTYVGTVMEPPVEKPQSIWCKMALYGGQRVYLYLAKDSLAQSLAMGDRLMFHARIRKPSNEGLSFDYASYLLGKGISGTGYVPTDSWSRMEGIASLSLKQKALLIREKIVDRYKEWGIKEEQLPVLSALTVGDKVDLSDEVRASYSTAGISHVLALSGMHIGFLWMMVGFLLKPLERKKLQWLKWCISTALLWTFAFVAGLETSVVRAVLMCMLMEFGPLLGYPSLTINTLSIAAFFMLLYRPFYLFDVGFQLSFLAVLSILLFYERLFSLCSSRSPILRCVWSVVSVSIAAQLGTAPLIMYYFYNFSAYFLLANIGVALLVPCVIYIALASMVFAFFPWLHRWLIVVLDKMVGVLNDFAGWISTLPYASLSVVTLHQIEVWGLYLLLGVTGWYFMTRKRRIFIALLVAIASWLALHCCLVLK